MMKQPYDAPQDLMKPILQVDNKGSMSYHLFWMPQEGGGFPGGRGPLGGGPSGGWGPPPMALVQPQPVGKLVGDPLAVYDGEQTKTQLFINQWELYWGVNNDNPLMINPY